MRPSWLVAGVTVLALDASAIISQSKSIDLKAYQEWAAKTPIRKAGYWEITTSRDGSPPVNRGTTCIGQVHVFGNPNHPEDCASRRSGRTWVFDCSSLGPDGSGTVTHAVMTGDPASKYTIVVNTDTSGVALPAFNGRHSETWVAIYKGACH